MKKIQLVFVFLTILAIVGTVAYKKHGGDFMVDPRDGKSYKTVEIGNQIWMAENLNYESEGSYCYNNLVDSCAKYGRLYTWASAMDSVGRFSTDGVGCGFGTTCSPTYPVQGVCPNGWHLPSKSESADLFKTVGLRFTKNKDYGEEFSGGWKLRTKSGWYKNSRNGVKGVDQYDFSALPAGNRTVGGLFNDVLINTGFWNSTEGNDSVAYRMFVGFDSIAGIVYSYRKFTAVSVRCLKDEVSSGNTSQDEMKR